MTPEPIACWQSVRGRSCSGWLTTMPGSFYGTTSGSCGGAGRLAESRALPSIADLAEQLQVSLGVGAAHRQRDDVVVLEVLLRAAVDAAPEISLPHRHLDMLWNRLALGP